ncbi:mechanosensitive ion channel family protein [Umboniibacter marinipuniceus]|uniref:Small-conductance mechanosensitive channel n=1 Tax=Umboniibacter marinipuniceus TaxID=569599 RepID=A0A3M0AFQ0_9GAMM|nr:mechanosensitive ion channel domain-containing protein [Umboniibacter marinipuniceus]RMA82419.1 mechanosensitive ion channel-like protein [Umboniibacter marinipuniceus]
MSPYVKVSTNLVIVLTAIVSASSSMGQELSDTPEIALGQLSELIRWSGVLSSVVLVLAVVVGMRFIHNIVQQISEQFVQRRLLLHKLETILQFAVYITTTIVVFNLSLRVDERVLALIGGTLAVAVGFGLKDLVASFIAGLIIMIDRPFQVGDRLSFDEQYGDVVSIGLRSVRLKTLNDDIVTIPNNKFLSDTTVSGNFGELDMHVGMDFFIGYDQDVSTARAIIEEAAASSRYIHLPRPIVVLVEQTVLDNYVAIKLRLKAYVLDTRYEKLFETDVNLRVIEAFRKKDIKPAAILHRHLQHPESEPAQPPLENSAKGTNS